MKNKANNRSQVDISQKAIAYEATSKDNISGKVVNRVEIASDEPLSVFDPLPEPEGLFEEEVVVGELPGDPAV